MMVDNAVFVGSSQIRAPQVDTLPASPAANAMVYLMQVDGSNQPGLYMYISSAWKWLSNSDPVT